jgi:hypothetical protein
MLSAAFVFAADLSVDPMLIRIYLLNQDDMANLGQLNLDVAYLNKDYADIVAYPQDEINIQNAGLHYEIVQPNLIQFYQSRFSLTTSMGGYLTFPEVLALIDSLHQAFPAICSARDSVGFSWQGRAVWVFKISDNVDVDENEPEVFFNALIHAREPQGMQWQMNYARWLCQNYSIDPEAASLVENHEIFFMPVVNPDGYEKNRTDYPNGGGLWRKNRRPPGGVDLNRNFGYMWGYDNIGSSPDSSAETYRGPSAFSEPETQAIRRFVHSRHFSFIMNAHTYGDYFLYPFGYASIYTPDEDLYQIIADTALAILGTYTAGTPWELLYNSNGDAMDWEYGEQDEKPLILCSTVESGNESDGFWPAPSRIPQINAQLLPLAKYITRLAENPRAAAPPKPPIMNPLDTVRSDSFEVSWTHNDASNPATAFELVEKSGFSLITDSLERGGGNWQLSEFNLSTTRYHSASHSLFSGDLNNLHSRAIWGTPITIGVNDSLVFWTWYNIETDYDYAYVEVSTNGGHSYLPIAGNITTNANPHNLNRGNGITGPQVSWIRAIFPLNQYAGQTIRLRFSYDTDGRIRNGGFYIDDIFPVPNFAQALVISSQITANHYLIQGRANGSYFYQARAIDAQNQWSVFSELVNVIVERNVGISAGLSIPSDFDLKQNYPNPFNGQTLIAFSLASPGDVKLEIFDIAGRLIRSLLAERMDYGNHQIIWDGKNNGEQDVASGIYFYRLSTENKSTSRRMIFLR